MARFRALYLQYQVESWLVAAALGLCAIVGIVEHLLLVSGSIPNYVGLLGAPLDDVFIHCRVADNLLHGFGFSFNPPDVVTADTSPLWVLLIALGGLFTTHLELVAIALSIACYLILTPGVYRVARDLLHLSERNARLAGWAMLLTSRMIWSAMSGMESALAALLMLLAVEAHVRARKCNCVGGKEAIWLGLALLTRPEFYFVAIVLLADWLYAKYNDNANLSRAGISIAMLFAIASPAFFLPLISNGSFVSHSADVQRARPAEGFFLTLVHAGGILAEPNIILIALLFAGIAFYWNDKTLRAMGAIVFLMPFAQAIAAPQLRHHGRYLFPLYPLIILLAMNAWDLFERDLRWPSFKRIIPIAIIVVALLDAARWTYITASDVRNINDQHLAVVAWLNTTMQPSDTLAAGDVGAIGYFVKKPVIDITGLVTPALWLPESGQDSVWRMARAMGANVFVIYPRWSPAFFARHKDSLELVRSFPVRLPLTSAADTSLNLYRVQHGG